MNINKMEPLAPESAPICPTTPEPVVFVPVVRRVLRRRRYKFKNLYTK